MKITQKLLDELSYLISNTTGELKGKKAVIFRTAKGLRDAIYSESRKDESLVEFSYYREIERLADDFLDNYWNEWKEDTGSWGLKSRKKDDISFYQWSDYAGQLHEFVDSSFYSFDADEILEKSNEVEDDYGLWDGLKTWSEIRDTIAFYTLKNDLCFAILEKAKNLAVNEDIDGAKID